MYLHIIKSLPLFIGLFFTVFCTLLPPPSPILSGRIIRDLSLFPLNGPQFRLSDLKNIKAIVIVMREKDCPISEKYGLRLARLEKEYSKKGIHFIYSYVGQVNTEKSAKQDLEKFGFKSSYVIDKKQTIINVLNAKTTGEVFVLTPERSVVYKGPVDDQYHLLKSSPQAKNHYLSDVLKKMVSGKPVIPKEIPAPGCIINRPFIKKADWSDVAPIISKKCTICHNPFSEAPINYLSYKDVAGRLAMFRYVIANDLMPPWNLDPQTGPWKKDLSLTVEEKATLLKWIDRGAKKDVISKESIWNKNKPFFKKKPDIDWIISLPEKVIISPEKANVYKRFFITTNFKEDKWIKNLHFKLMPKVIHHSFFLILSADFKGKEKTHWRKYVLNKVHQNFESLLSDEIGVKLPKSSTLVWEIHYEPFGQEVIDESSHIQITFNKKKPKYKATSLYLIFNQINIPPHQANYQTQMSQKIKEDILVLGLSSHMHLRGKGSDIFVIDPQGSKQRIFGINPWNIKFEKSYILKKPLNISKNSTIKCVNYFDNSKNNPWNPNPEKRVLTGDFIEDEMSWCRLILLYPSNSKPLL